LPTDELPMRSSLTLIGASPDLELGEGGIVRELIVKEE
jgi:hypothetical protein